MKYFLRITNIALVLVAISGFIISGCNPNQEKPKADKKPQVSAPLGPRVNNAPIPPEMADAVVVVDGVKLTKSALEKELAGKMNMLKAELPSNKINEAKNEIRSKSLTVSSCVRYSPMKLIG